MGQHSLFSLFQPFFQRQWAIPLAIPLAISLAIPMGTKNDMFAEGYVVMPSVLQDYPIESLGLMKFRCFSPKYCEVSK